MPAEANNFGNEIIKGVTHANGVAYDWEAGKGYVTVYDNDFVEIECELTETTSPTSWTNGAYVKN